MIYTTYSRHTVWEKGTIALKDSFDKHVLNQNCTPLIEEQCRLLKAIVRCKLDILFYIDIVRDFNAYV
jgi:hypothetical protein